MAIVQWRVSPLEPTELAPFLTTQVGRVPGKRLLKTMESCCLVTVGSKGWVARADLIRNIVQAAVGTPGQDDVLEAAITFESLRFLGLRPFFEQCLSGRIASGVWCLICGWDWKTPTSANYLRLPAKFRYRRA